MTIKIFNDNHSLNTQSDLFFFIFTSTHIRKIAYVFVVCISHSSHYTLFDAIHMNLFDLPALLKESASLPTLSSVLLSLVGST